MRTRFEVLRVALEEVGIAARPGSRWPGAHLRARAREDRVHSVQLEIGLPLRWRGPWGERLSTRLAGVLGRPPAGWARGRSMP